MRKASVTRFKKESIQTPFWQINLVLFAIRIWNYEFSEGCYSCSKNSLITNYLTSLIEGLIISVSITVLIIISRKIGLMYLNKNIYNASKYINQNF